MTIEMSQDSGNLKRLFVGNLFPDVSQSDLEKLFAKFGKVRDCEIKTKKDIDGKVVSTFAFVNANFFDASKLPACIQVKSERSRT